MKDYVIVVIVVCAVFIFFAVTTLFYFIKKGYCQCFSNNNKQNDTVHIREYSEEPNQPEPYAREESNPSLRLPSSFTQQWVQPNSFHTEREQSNAWSTNRHRINQTEYNIADYAQFPPIERHNVTAIREFGAIRGNGVARPSRPTPTLADKRNPRMNVGLTQNVQVNVPVHSVVTDGGRKKRKWKPADPELYPHDEDYNGRLKSAKIMEMQEGLREDATPNETVCEVQRLLLSSSRSRNCEDNCKLIIGVDATPGVQAGYCVNITEKRLHYYVIKRADLPWVLHDSKDPSEFEMKNFIFALTVWKKEILKFKRISIYTDNFAIDQPFGYKKYGERACQLLNHFVHCEGVVVLNRQETAVNRFRNLENFAKYIKPADDLSRWQIKEALEFLTTMYDIEKENIDGTHKIGRHPRSRGHASSKAWYDPTPRYQQVLQHAKNMIEDYQCEKKTCSDLLHASLRIR